MDVEALASLESQTHFCQDLISKVLDHESFILLAGESGSGRTTACEYVVNETDTKLRAVFIPCNPDLPLQRLRELFLHQLLPNTEFDTTLNLADALSQVVFPSEQKILIVVDDVDSVIVSFYNELLALYEQFLGQNRFAFIFVCHPMWAEEKIRSYMGKAQLTLKQIPALNLKETLVLSRHIFALENTMRIYNAIVDKLPTALAPAKGNLSQIITITEKLMKDPTAAQNSGTDKGQTVANQSQIKKKKSSSVGIFVSVVCIIIVLACLIPILFGGNFFSSSPSSTTATSGANDDALVFDENQYEIDDGVLPPKVPTGLDAPTQDTGTEHSVTLSGEELDKIEGGANNSGYPRGVDGSVNKANTASAQSPNNAAASAAAALLDEPLEEDLTVPPQVALSNESQQPSLPVLQRTRNINHASKPQEMTPTTPPDLSNQVAAINKRAEEEERAKLEQAAKDKLEADRKLAQEAKQKEELAQAQAKKDLEAKKKAEQQAQVQAQAQAQAQRPSRPPLRAGQIINLADEQRQLEQQRQASANRQPQPYRPDNAPASNVSGSAVEGSTAELSNIANSHFTVQIVSASNRANIKAAAQGLNGKYWILETRRNNRPWYVLCSGDYASRAEAAAAATRIPRSVSQGATPFAKSISDLKGEFRL